MYLHDIDVLVRTLVLVFLVNGGGRPVQDVIQVKTVRFGTTSFLFVESLQVVHGCAGTPGEKKIQKQTLTTHYRRTLLDTC